MGCGSFVCVVFRCFVEVDGMVVGNLLVVVNILLVNTMILMNINQ